MEAHISVASDSAVGDTESLEDWLRGEPELAGRVRKAAHEPDPTELGTAIDVLTVALGAGGAVSVLASCLRAWFSQPRRSDVRVKIRRPGGDAVDIDAKRVHAADLEAILRQALRTDGEE